MGDVHYMISEAAKRVNVETHVLRYWEEELNLPIGRTEMGHRYYTEENIRLFRCIKELKEQGLLLKDLKDLVPEMMKLRAEMKTPKEKKQEVTIASPEVIEITDTHLRQAEALLGGIFQNVLTENNKVLEKNISDKVLKDMDFLLQAKERQEEERFKKLDCLIRQQQTFRKESVKMAQPHGLRHLADLFLSN